ncbi:hypothetical protein NSS79_24090 [Paenibacillus sp. FSL L8-0436]|uniref:hypothetical protein n=1 Tax=Paenibacillus sp. FSL L8-0436 TaxID=2954686 RepID=UPI0031587C4F
MTQLIKGTSVKKNWAKYIPVLYIEPEEPLAEKKLLISLNGLCGAIEELTPKWQEIVTKGYIVLTFENAGNGERETEAPGNIVGKLINFQTTSLLDLLSSCCD